MRLVRISFAPKRFLRKAGMPAREQDRDQRPGDRPDRQLALGADVPDVGHVADGKAGAHQDQRGRLDDELFDRPQGGHRLDKIDMERIQRVETARRKDDGTGEQSQSDRHNRRKPDHEL
jgi:hypothetical protein